MDLLLALTLIVLHSVDGFEIIINPQQVVILRPTAEAARGTPNQLVARGVQCVIGLADGKFVSVIEACAVVQAAIERPQ